MSLPASEETGTDRPQEGGSSRPSSSPARLIIADDHALVREGMQTLLAKETDLVVVGEAENGQEAVELCRSLSPDLVLMDVRMPKMDGLQATQKIKEECPQISVLIVTSYENPEYLLDAIRAGAAGYVLKEATRRQLLSAIRRTLEGESPLNQELAMDLLRRLAKERQQAGRRTAAPSAEAARKRRGGGPPPESLTPRELDILRLIASGKTNRQIAQELTLSRGTVKTHVERIISKLGASDRTRAAVTAIELGLLPGQGEQEQQRW